MSSVYSRLDASVRVLLMDHCQDASMLIWNSSGTSHADLSSFCQSNLDPTPEELFEMILFRENVTHLETDAAQLFLAELSKRSHLPYYCDYAMDVKHLLQYLLKRASFDATHCYLLDAADTIHVDSVQLLSRLQNERDVGRVRADFHFGYLNLPEYQGWYISMYYDIKWVFIKIPTAPN